MPDASVTVLDAPTRAEFDQQVEGLLEEPDDLDGWWCVRTAPFPCPAAGCDYVADFLTAAHLIVVWPRKDDRELLTAAFDAQRLGRQPRAVEYQRSFGPCVAFDLWMRVGRPVHGLIPRPEGTPHRQF